MALFVAGLSFDGPALTDPAKIGIIGASIIAGPAGLAVLRLVGSPAVSAGADRNEEAAAA